MQADGEVSPKLPELLEGPKVSSRSKMGHFGILAPGLAPWPPPLPLPRAPTRLPGSELDLWPPRGSPASLSPTGWGLDRPTYETTVPHPPVREKCSSHEQARYGLLVPAELTDRGRTQFPEGKKRPFQAFLPCLRQESLSGL